MSSKVLLVVIDAASPHVVCPAVHTGRLPVMQRLAEIGDMHAASATIFPSITPAATSTIITGAYPAEHGIAGASWFDAERGEIVYYGDDFWVIAREGFGCFVNDFLLRLNGDRLRAPTMFEMVERTGRRAACLNYLVFKGNVPHRVNMPGLMAALPGVPFTETVEGPSLLALGDFVGVPTPHGHPLDKEGGLLHRFGMDDESTGAMLRHLAAEGTLPEFTVAYFADNDYASHEVGPLSALPVVERVDRLLGEAFAAAGGLDRFLADTAVVITSDHGHCDIRADDRALVRIDRLLANFRQADIPRGWRSDDQIMICPNMRAAQIYLRKPTPDLVQRIATALLLEENVDQVIWCSRLTGGSSGYTVLSHRGRLEFSRAPGGDPDVFGNRWTWRGEPAVVDMHRDDGRLHFGDYPNAFERIAGVIDLDKSGELWVTVKPGCEIEVPGSKAHPGGGSHGALHALDSLSPVIVAGGAAPRRLPTHLRSLDIAPLCMEILGIPMRYRVGDPRG
ncbi:MAG TPA: alkaline phosphatase family protein [Vicinamibacterales bacterium]|nr:alkaline phosphatase family protein [Vicinamibacterales bacterium]